MKPVIIKEKGVTVKAYCFNPTINKTNKTIKCDIITKRGVYRNATIVNGTIIGNVIPWLLPASIEVVTMALGLTYQQVVKLANEI